MLSITMPADLSELPNDPAGLKAMVAALQAENNKMSATLRTHDLLIQSLRILEGIRMTAVEKRMECLP